MQKVFAPKKKTLLGYTQKFKNSSKMLQKHITGQSGAMLPVHVHLLSIACCFQLLPRYTSSIPWPIPRLTWAYPSLKNLGTHGLRQKTFGQKPSHPITSQIPQNNRVVSFSQTQLNRVGITRVSQGYYPSFSVHQQVVKIHQKLFDNI